MNLINLLWGKFLPHEGEDGRLGSAGLGRERARWRILTEPLHHIRKGLPRRRRRLHAHRDLERTAHGLHRVVLAVDDAHHQPHVREQPPGLAVHGLHGAGELPGLAIRRFQGTGNQPVMPVCGLDGVGEQPGVPVRGHHGVGNLPGLPVRGLGQGEHIRRYAVVAGDCHAVDHSPAPCVFARATQRNGYALLGSR